MIKRTLTPGVLFNFVTPPERIITDKDELHTAFLNKGLTGLVFMLAKHTHEKENNFLSNFETYANLFLHDPQLKNIYKRLITEPTNIKAICSINKEQFENAIVFIHDNFMEDDFEHMVDEYKKKNITPYTGIETSRGAREERIMALIVRLIHCKSISPKKQLSDLLDEPDLVGITNEGWAHLGQYYASIIYFSYFMQNAELDTNGNGSIRLFIPNMAETLSVVMFLSGQFNYFIPAPQISEANRSKNSEMVTNNKTVNVYAFKKFNDNNSSRILKDKAPLTPSEFINIDANYQNIKTYAIQNNYKGRKDENGIVRSFPKASSVRRSIEKQIKKSAEIED